MITHEEKTQYVIEEIYNLKVDDFTPIEAKSIEVKSIEVRLKNPTELNLNK